MSLFLIDSEISLLENIVAITLLRKYGRDYAVFFYNEDVEVDFYLPDETKALMKLPNLMSFNANLTCFFADSFNLPDIADGFN